MNASLDTIYNPLTNETVTFLPPVGDADANSSVVEIRLGPRAKGPPLHYHTAHSEMFEVVEGELALRVGAETFRLRPGQQATAAINQLHTFWSETDAPVTFRGTISPRNVDFENCFRIGFGLARDGLCTSSGIPRNPYHLAILSAMSRSRGAGLLSVVMWLLERLATTEKCRAIQQDLVRRYCPPVSTATT